MTKTSLAALGLALLATSGLAHAQDTGGYVLGAFGRSSFDIDCTGIARCDKSGSMVKLVGGYKVNPNIALEGVALNFGKATFDDFGITGDVKVRAFGIGGAVWGDFSPQLSAALRLGVASVRTTASGRGFGISVSESETKIKPYVGAALAFRFSPAVWVEAGIDSTNAEVDGDDGRVSGISLGVGVRF